MAYRIIKNMIDIYRVYRMTRVVQEENDKIAGDKTLEELNSRIDLVKKKDVITIFLSIRRYKHKKPQFAETVYRYAKEQEYILSRGGYETLLEVNPSKSPQIITRIGKFPIGMINEVLRGYGPILAAFFGAITVIIVSALSGLMVSGFKWLIELLEKYMF